MKQKIVVPQLQLRVRNREGVEVVVAVLLHFILLLKRFWGSSESKDKHLKGSLSVSRWAECRPGIAVTSLCDPAAVDRCRQMWMLFECNTAYSSLGLNGVQKFQARIPKQIVLSADTVNFLRSRKSSVNTVTKLRAGHPSSHLSIYNAIYRFFFSPNRSAALGPTRGCCTVGEGFYIYIYIYIYI